jgi:hypothetical protein
MGFLQELNVDGNFELYVATAQAVAGGHHDRLADGLGVEKGSVSGMQVFHPPLAVMVG